MNVCDISHWLDKKKLETRCGKQTGNRHNINKKKATNWKISWQKDEYKELTEQTKTF